MFSAVTHANIYFLCVKVALKSSLDNPINAERRQDDKIFWAAEARSQLYVKFNKMKTAEPAENGGRLWPCCQTRVLR